MKRNAVLLALSLLVLAMAIPVFGQGVPPALMVKLKDRSEPLGLSKVDAQVRIVGYVAETVTTLTFANPHDRVLQGDLYFPLPEGATISGYALDIDGKLIDGVAVEKDKGRAVFEKIVRQNVDPGLIEWTRGNNFKTRVFPIPARGSRTIRVKYVTELAGEADDPAYHLPLNFSRPVDEFSLRIEVVKQAVAPRVAGGKLANFEFKAWRESYIAETKLTDATLTEDLLIAVPNVDKSRVAVECTPEGDCYFAIHDLPAIPRLRRAASLPRHVVLFWDASGSRTGKHEREIGLLKRYFQTYWPAGNAAPALDVDLVLVRNARHEPIRFTCSGGDFAPLLDRLETIDYDGGTQLGTLAPPGSGPTPDFYLLVSDGLANFGSESSDTFDAPLYVVSADVRSNHAFLKQMATSTGGRYFNLNRLTDEEVTGGIGRTAYSYLSAASIDSQASDLYPKLPEPLAGRLTLVGKLTGSETTVTVRYGYPGRSATARNFRVSRADATEGSLLENLWAQKKLAELILLPDRHRNEIVELGQRFGLVTPFTSLIVLDSLDQYVENDIAPPKSLPEMRDQYMRRIDTLEHQRGKQRADKIDTVLAMWRARLEWYDTKFKYPENFRYREEAEKKDAGNRNGAAPAGGENAEGGELDDEARPVAPAESPAMRPREVPATEDAPVPSDEAFDAEPDPDGPHPVEEFEPESLDKIDVDEDKSRQPGIAIREWDPKTPYLAELKAADSANLFAVYMKNRAEYGESPAFYLDCADFFRQRGERELSLQVLSNIAELDLENPQLLRVLAHRLAQLGYLDLAVTTFDQVLTLRPEEPQSYRDLALVLALRADQRRATRTSGNLTELAQHWSAQQVREDYARAIDLLYQTVLGNWDGRFEEIEMIALTELNRLLPLAKEAGVTNIEVDQRLVRLLEFDVRIVMTWHADNTDIDLWVIEPSDEKAYYSHNRTTIGGLVSRDFTGGYGPEEYLVRRAMHGTYAIKANYYGSRETRLLGEVTVQVDVFTNYGRDAQQHKSLTIRLKEAKDTIDIGQIEF